MKSSVRHRPKDATQVTRKVSWNSEILTHEDCCARQHLTESPSLTWPLVLLYILLISLLGVISLYFDSSLPTPVTSGKPNQFHASKARSHLEDLTSLGVRYVGGAANEIHAKNLIIGKLEELKSKASAGVEFEISIQHPSGNFYIDFLGGMTHVYQNLTNIVVRLSKRGSNPKHSFLINAHYDSALGSIGASDDAVSCGTMLETIRCLSSDPDPLVAENGLIFLFNGAEETFMQASHGFITQHPWANSVRAFLNLEAAGAGGKEIVFQTGPDHPWLAKLYSSKVPHPHASVFAQELFQTGVMPADTDFRIFRDFGHLPGIDTAYFINGYVYHSEFDVPSAIPNGSIQRAGENIVTLLREVVNSPSLSSPSMEDQHGNLVFFDILGLMGVAYSEQLAMVMNFGLCCLVLLLLVMEIDWRKSRLPFSNKPTPKLFLISLGTLLLSWLAALLVTVAVGGILTLLGRSMTWYSNPLLILPLYGLPAFLAIAEVHAQLIKKVEKQFSMVSIEKCSFLAIQFLWTVFLAVLTTSHSCTSFILFITVASHVIFRCLLLETLISRELGRCHFMYGVAYTLCSACSTGLPWMILILMNVKILQVLVPLMGRSGSLVPPDVAIGGLMGILVAISTPHMICVFIYSTSKVLKRTVGASLLLVAVLTLLVTADGFFKPYSIQDKNFPTPKRIIIIHTDRTFHSVNGSITKEDSRVIFCPVDYLGIAPIAEVSPLVQEALLFDCEGLYCGEPVYFPVRHFMNTWYLPAASRAGRIAPTVKLISMQKTSQHLRNFTFRITFPVQTTGILGMSEGVSLKAWSLLSYVPPPNPCPGSHADRGCYFIFQSCGFGEGAFNFWVETLGNSASEESFRLLLTSHYLDPLESKTDDLGRILKTLPDWTTPTSWTAALGEWVF